MGWMTGGISLVQAYTEIPLVPLSTFAETVYELFLVQVVQLFECDELQYALLLSEWANICKHREI